MRKAIGFALVGLALLLVACGREATSAKSVPTDVVSASKVVPWNTPSTGSKGSVGDMVQCPPDASSTGSSPEKAVLGAACLSADALNMSLDFHQPAIPQSTGREFQVMVVAEQPECASDCPRQVQKAFQVTKRNSEGGWHAEELDYGWVETRSSIEAKTQAQFNGYQKYVLTFSTKKVVTSTDATVRIEFTANQPLPGPSGPGAQDAFIPEVKLVLDGDPKEYIFTTDGMDARGAVFLCYDLEKRRVLRETMQQSGATIVAYRVTQMGIDAPWRPVN